MDINNEKCVIIINAELSLGSIANIAAILGMTLGKHMPEIVGKDVTDKSGCNHLGLIQFPVPILKAPMETIKETRLKLCEKDFDDVTVVDFSNKAQECMTYDDYTNSIMESNIDELQYFGVAICGPKKKVNKLTGSMALLR